MRTVRHGPSLGSPVGVGWVAKRGQSCSPSTTSASSRSPESSDFFPCMRGRPGVCLFERPDPVPPDRAGANGELPDEEERTRHRPRANRPAGRCGPGFFRHMAEFQKTGGRKKIVSLACVRATAHTPRCVRNASISGRRHVIRYRRFK